MFTFTISQETYNDLKARLAKLQGKIALFNDHAENDYKSLEGTFLYPHITKLHKEAQDIRMILRHIQLNN